MTDDSTTRVSDLAAHRRKRGLTQGDLARLLGVTQQAVAKWESSGLVPDHRIKNLSKHLRVPTDAIRRIEDAGSEDQKEARLHAWMGEFFADQVVVCFDTSTFHYCPSSEEVGEFWRDLQSGGFVHLSAGPVQVLINMDAVRRVDMSEDPPLNQYEPPPTSPIDHDDESSTQGAATEGEGEDVSEGQPREMPTYWFDRGEARIFVRGVKDPYIGPQTFLESADNAPLTKAALADLAEAFECHRPDENGIFELFWWIYQSADSHDFSYDRGEHLHADSLHVFQSEDFDSVPQRTWVHTRDIQVIEIPTRLWELHLLAQKARAERSEEEERARASIPKKVRKGKGLPGIKKQR